ncbi:MAG: hypothetical protein LQ347_003739 [Umbilicaria vellea]|nr:MAG: hypothetical protein LQ347_003739 [Umbilicaria vellea]
MNPLDKDLKLVKVRIASTNNASADRNPAFNSVRVLVQAPKPSQIFWADKRSPISTLIKKTLNAAQKQLYPFISIRSITLDPASVPPLGFAIEG